MSSVTTVTLELALSTRTSAGNVTLDWTRAPARFSVPRLTALENVRSNAPVFLSSTKLTSVGGVLSAVNFLT